MKRAELSGPAPVTGLRLAGEREEKEDRGCLPEKKIGNEMSNDGGRVGCRKRWQLSLTRHVELKGGTAPCTKGQQ